jgi:hypothetical protein
MPSGRMASQAGVTDDDIICDPRLSEPQLHRTAAMHSVCAWASAGRDKRVRSAGRGKELGAIGAGPDVGVGRNRVARRC